MLGWALNLGFAGGGAVEAEEALWVARRGRGAPLPKKKRKPEEEAPPWWTGEWIVPGQDDLTPTKVETAVLPRVEPKPGIALALDALKAEGEALKAELSLSKAETKWLGGRLRTLTKAVAAAQEITERRKVQNRLVQFRARLKALEHQALERERQRVERIARDEDEFITILRLVV